MEITTTYKGFKFNLDQGFIVFHHPDMEDGSGDWSGGARTIEDAYEIIDSIIEEMNPENN
jgi:hypothetical protein